MIKLIVSDLDGTLINMQNKVSEEDIQALKRAAAHDIDIAIASGRMDNEIADVLNQIGAQYHRISQNGAFVYTDKNDELQAITFPQEVIHQVYHDAHHPDFVTLVANHNTNFIEKKGKAAEKIEERMFFPLVEKPQLFNQIGKKQVEPSKISVLGDDAKVRALQQQIEEQYNENVDSFISNVTEHTCLDIMPKHISKGKALTLLLDYLGLTSNEVACIGDSYNDLSMFKVTPHSFAMEDGHPDVKKEASHVVKTVAEAIEIALEKNEAKILS